jgi:hypothetical protein
MKNNYLKERADNGKIMNSAMVFIVAFVILFFAIILRFAIR